MRGTQLAAVVENAKPYPEVVLRVRCVVRKRGMHVVCLQCAHTESRAQSNVEPTAQLHRKGRCPNVRAIATRENRIVRTHAAEKAFAKNLHAMATRCRPRKCRQTPRISRAGHESCLPHVHAGLNIRGVLYCEI